MSNKKPVIPASAPPTPTPSLTLKNPSSELACISLEYSDKNHPQDSSASLVNMAASEGEIGPNLITSQWVSA